MTRIAINRDYLKRIKLVVILASARSGTTMLQSMMNAHPKIVVPFESMMIPHLFRRFHALRVWNKTVADELVAHLSCEYQYARHWKPDSSRTDRLRNLLYAYQEVPSFEELIKMILLAEEEQLNAITAVGIKTPRHNFFLPLFKAHFPNAHYVHLIRDPRSVLLSHMRNLGYLSFNYLLVHWKRDNLLIADLVSDLPNAYSIQYEDLVAQPQDRLTALCLFLELGFEDSMLNFQEEVKKEREAGHPFLSWAHHANLEKAVNQDSINKWKSGLSQHQIESIEAYCGHFMDELGYHLETQVSINSFQFKQWLLERLYKVWKGAINAYFKYLPLELRLAILNLRLKALGKSALTLK